MVWFRVDDSFGDHPKVEALLAGRCPDSAIALWTLAGAWCAKQLTDGQVPAVRVPRFGVKAHARAAAELVRVGLWVTTSDGFAFHQWADRQPSRVTVEAQREAGAARQERYRNARVTRDDGVSNAVTKPSVTPLPSLPFPDHALEEGEERARSESPTPSDSEPLPFDTPPESPRKPSREPAAIVRRLFADAYLETRKTIWPHAAHGREIDALAEWAQAQARADGVDVEHVVERVIAAACADSYLVGADLPLRLIVKQAGALYRPPPKAATGPPKVLNSALIRSCEEAIEAERKKRTPNADTIASLERTVANERAHPSGEPEDPRAAYGRRR